MITIEERFDRLEALLQKALGIDTEDIQVAAAEAVADTDVVLETEEKDVADSEVKTPSNRKSNVDVGLMLDEDGEEVEKQPTFRRKQSDSTTRIRQTLEQFV